MYFGAGESRHALCSQKQQNQEATELISHFQLLRLLPDVLLSVSILFGTIDFEHTSGHDTQLFLPSKISVKGGGMLGSKN